MAWLEAELSLGVRRLLAVLLAVWTWLMAVAGFGLLIVGLVLRAYVVDFLREPTTSAVSSASTSTSSVVWYSYSVVVVGTAMTATYALAFLVS